MANGNIPEDEEAEELGEPGEGISVTVRPSISMEAADQQARGSQSWVGLLLFAIGIACGVPAALFVPSFLADYGAAVLSIILGAMLFATVLMAIIFIFRDPLWRWLFRRTEVEVTKFAGPLADVARSAAEKNVPEATAAARHFAELALTRYAWVTMRRWLVASITGMIAAIAALAGSALLFEQNKLLRQQSGLLVEQNQRIDQQNALIDTQIQLAEAERSAQIGPEVVEIGALMGAERQAFLDGGGNIDDFGIAALSSSIRGRIAAATLVARPYRYLSSGIINPRDPDGLNRLALARRPDIVADPSVLDDPDDGSGGPLVDRPVSPERGDMLSMLVANSVLQTEPLSFIGADFSFAEYRREVLPGMSLRHALLAFADFSWTRIVQSQFGAAQLDHARFENAVIRQSVFSSLPAAEVREPFSAGDFERVPTAMAGVSFRNSVLHQTGFAYVNAMAPVFDDAVVSDCDFTGAQLGGASFRGAMIIGSRFGDALLLSLDLEGAVVFEQSFLTRLAQEARPGAFVAERWKLVPIPAGEVAAHPRYFEMTNHVPESAYTVQAWRIERVAGK